MTGRTSCRDNAVPTASPYVNHFEVAHNPFEFLIEFGQFRPGKDEGEGQLDIHTVLAISPPYAKMLADLLLRAVDQYEDANGAIASATELATPFDIVLRSLPEFEDRARRLRARRRDEARAAGHPQESQLHPGKGR
ncbi:MAG TPA: DUF3467 domain-containing protein [Aestuariivirga sp.]|nr:DUF3467 domain-containing protein [Aestuariivirga sp.]